MTRKQEFIPPVFLLAENKIFDHATSLFYNKQALSNRQIFVMDDWSSKSEGHKQGNVNIELNSKHVN